MDPWLILLIGVIWGLLLNWLIDRGFFVRKKHKNEKRIKELDLSLQASDAQIAEKKTQLESLQADHDAMQVSVTESPETEDEIDGPDVEVISDAAADLEQADLDGIEIEEAVTDEVDDIEATDVLAGAAVVAAASDAHEEAAEEEQDINGAERSATVDLAEDLADYELEGGIGVSGVAAAGVAAGAVALGAVLVGSDEEAEEGIEEDEQIETTEADLVAPGNSGDEQDEGVEALGVAAEAAAGVVALGAVLAGSDEKAEEGIEEDEQIETTEADLVAPGDSGDEQDEGVGALGVAAGAAAGAVALGAVLAGSDDDEEIEADGSTEQDELADVEVAEDDEGESERDEGMGAFGAIAGAVAVGAAIARSDEDKEPAADTIEEPEQIETDEPHDLVQAEADQALDLPGRTEFKAAVKTGAPTIASAILAKKLLADGEEPEETLEEEQEMAVQPAVQPAESPVEQPAESSVEQAAETIDEVPEAPEPTEEEIANLKLIERAERRLKQQKVNTIKGIGAATVKKLAEVDIVSCYDLLGAASTPTSRKHLASDTKIAPKNILTWANRADLKRIKGVGSEYADLLEASGVDTVPELAQRNPEHLHSTMKETNQKKMIVRRLPTAKQIGGWIQDARVLPRMIHY